MSDIEITISKRYYIQEGMIPYIEKYAGESIFKLTDIEICQIVDKIMDSSTEEPVESISNTYTIIE